MFVADSAVHFEQALAENKRLKEEQHPLQESCNDIVYCFSSLCLELFAPLHYLHRGERQ